MSETLGRAILILSTDSKALDAGVAKGKRSAQSLATRFRKVGREITTSFGLPIIALGGHILKTAADFEQGMNRIQALTSATGAEFQALEEQARQLGGTTQFSASQAADAMGFLAQSGANANEILAQMPATLNLAAAGMIDLGQSADIVTNIMKGYGLEVEETTRVTDVLTAAFTGSNTNLQQLGEAMKFAGPVASGFGIQFEEAAAALGLMGNAGFQASLAGTALRGALVRLATPTDNVAEVIEGLGINVLDADKNMVSLVEIIKQLEDSGASTAEIMTIFGQRAGPAMAALVSQGSEALVKFTAVLENSGGRAKEVADVQMKGLTGELRNLKSAWEDMELTIAGSGFLTLVSDWVKGATFLIRELSGNMDRIRLVQIKGIIENREALERGFAAFGIQIDLSADLDKEYNELLKTVFKLTAATDESTFAIRAAAAGLADAENQVAGFTDAIKENIKIIPDLERAFNDSDDALIEFMDDVVGGTLLITEMGSGLFNAAAAAMELQRRIRELEFGPLERSINDTDDALTNFDDDVADFTLDITEMGDGLFHAANAAMELRRRIQELEAENIQADPGNLGDTFAGIGNQFAGQVAGVSGGIAGFQAGGGLPGFAAGFFADLLLRSDKMQELIGTLNEALVTLIEPIVTALAPSLEALVPLLEELQPVFEVIGKALAISLGPLVFQLKLVTDILQHVDEALKDLLAPLQRLADVIEDFSVGSAAGGGLGGVAGAVASTLGFHSGGHVGAADLARLPGMASNEGLALLQAGETVIAANRQVTIELHGDDNTTFSKRQIRALIDSISDELTDDSTHRLLQVAG